MAPVKKKIARIIVAIIAAILNIGSQPAFASEIEKTTIGIAQEIVNCPTSQDCLVVYTLESLEEGNPMPTEEGIYTFTLSNNSNITLPPIAFEHGGVYEYRITMKETPVISNMAWDDNTSYKVTVYIENTAQGLKTQEVYENSKGYKESSVNFTHTYQIPPTPEENSSYVSTGDNNLSLLLRLCISGISVFIIIKIRRKECDNVKKEK